MKLFTKQVYSFLVLFLFLSATLALKRKYKNKRKEGDPCDQKLGDKACTDGLKCFEKDISIIIPSGAAAETVSFKYYCVKDAKFEIGSNCYIQTFGSLCRRDKDVKGTCTKRFGYPLRNVSDKKNYEIGICQGANGSLCTSHENCESGFCVRWYKDNTGKLFDRKCGTSEEYDKNASSPAGQAFYAELKRQNSAQEVKPTTAVKKENYLDDDEKDELDQVYKNLMKGDTGFHGAYKILSFMLEYRTNELNLKPEDISRLTLIKKHHICEEVEEELDIMGYKVLDIWSRDQTLLDLKTKNENYLKGLSDSIEGRLNKAGTTKDVSELVQGIVATGEEAGKEAVSAGVELAKNTGLAVVGQIKDLTKMAVEAWLITDLSKKHAELHSKENEMWRGNTQLYKKYGGTISDAVVMLNTNICVQLRLAKKAENAPTVTSTPLTTTPVFKRSEAYKGKRIFLKKSIN